MKNSLVKILLLFSPYNNKAIFLNKTAQKFFDLLISIEPKTIN